MKKIPDEIQQIAQKLEANGFEAFLVGGCLRDMILGIAPKDWDVATNATPDEVQNLFFDFGGRTKEDPATVYENAFGTVGIKTESDDPTLKIIEVTTYRTEAGYSDMRHPDEVQFAKTIHEDLSRRDFTVNAIAFDLREKKISADNLVDPYGGVRDISKKIIRTVGDPNERFTEDALRLMRAVRFSAQLDFQIDEKTKDAIRFHAGLLEAIAKERVRDELTKLVMTDRASQGIIAMEDTGLLQYVIPELREGIGCGQNKHHIYTVFDHNVRALNYTTEKNYSLEIRLGALLHDVGKPKTKRGDGIDSTFHGHEVVGAKITARIMDRLRFSKDISERVIHLVRYHLFYYNVGEVSAAGVRRFISRVGIDTVDDLLKIREADRIGSGVPKAFPYKLRHLQFMIEKVRHDPVHPKMLKLNGNELMDLLGIKPSRRVGYILSILLEDVLEKPERNTKDYLEKHAQELNAHDDVMLAELSTKAREMKDEFEGEIEGEMKKKYKV